MLSAWVEPKKWYTVIGAPPEGPLGPLQGSVSAWDSSQFQAIKNDTCQDPKGKLCVTLSSIQISRLRDEDWANATVIGSVLHRSSVVYSHKQRLHRQRHRHRHSSFFSSSTLPCLRSHALIPSSPIHSATADLSPFVDTVFLTCFSLSYYISTTFRSKTSGLSPLPQTPFIATFQIENHQSLGHLLQLVDSSERQSSGSSAISVGFVVAATWYTL